MKAENGNDKKSSAAERERLISSEAPRPGAKQQIMMFKRLWKYLYAYRTKLFLALFLTLFSNLFALVGPYLSGKAIDAIVPGSVDFERVFLFCGLMGVFYVLSALLSYLLSALMIRLAKDVARAMRKDVFDHIQTLPVSFFDKYQTGDIINRISYDIDTINATLSTDFVQAATSTVTVLGSLIMMLTIEPLLVTVFALTIPASVLFTVYRARKVKPLFRARSAKLGELNGFTEEMLSGERTIKAYAAEDRIDALYGAKNKEASYAYYTADYYGSTIGPSVNFINNLSLSLISVIGTLLYINGSIMLGSISSFVLYSRKFSGPINEFANILSEFQSAAAAAERVFRLLDTPPETPDEPDAVSKDNAKGDISINNVTFGYLPGVPVIKELSVDVRKGSTVAIVGPTGAGKTTMISLLMRFYDVDNGSITLDGTDIRHIKRDSLRRNFSMVLQDTWLFSGTVAENIGYGRQGATREDIVNAAIAAGADSFINELENGYDTMISDDGVNVSKGQKQLLTIARAMLSDAPVMILDEATSNVDSATEKKIHDAMNRLMKSKTCFVIAHRLSTVENADVILFVSDGRITEQGTHKELLEAGGDYSRLYNSQYIA